VDVIMNNHNLNSLVEARSPYKVHFLIKVSLPTDAHENCFKRSIKIYIKTAQTCFGVITIIRERTI